LDNNDLGPRLRLNWRDATSLIELSIGANKLSSIDALPLSQMIRLLDLGVIGVGALSVSNNTY
jgi:hypothetical protein